MSRFPDPPVRLAERVGSLKHTKDRDSHDVIGRRSRERILSLLPADWTFEGKRVLDFGAGVGRVVRRFAEEGEGRELWACDIDGPSVDWMREHLAPEVRAFQNADVPPLDVQDEHFDLVWAISVFTHLNDTWADWLLELRRILKPGGLLIATFVGPRLGESMVGESWDEDRIGMNSLRHWMPWNDGGPLILHSEWWVRAHWGRAFEVLEFRRPKAEGLGHTWALFQKTNDLVDAAALKAVEPGEKREVAALQHNVAQLRAELDLIRAPAVWRLSRPARAWKRKAATRWRS